MAGHAGRVGILKCGGQVAVFAFDRLVLAQQGKPCQAVIKGRVVPRKFGVTVLALCSFLSLVDIVRVMTGITGGVELHGVELVGVTRVTVKRPVPAS